MTTDAEVRTWARDAGHDVPKRGKVPDALRELYDAAHESPDNPGLSGAEPSDGGPAEGPEPTPAAPSGAPADAPTGELRPTPPPGRFGFGRPAAKTSAPKTTRRRVSLEDVAAGVWAGLGQAAQAYGLVPTGRALVLQAPVAGMILEDTLRGTMVDRLAQPLARGGEAAKELGALFGIPALVTLVTVRPEARPMAYPIMRRLMRDWAILAGPRIKARERREKRALEALGVDDAGLDDMVDGWIEGLFAELQEPNDGA